MNEIKQQALKLLSNRKFLAVAFMVIGAGLIIFFGIRSYRSYQQLLYIQEQGLDRGEASLDAIRGWMTIRYVSVAYGVPEEYIFAQLDIPFDRRRSNDYLGRLNQEYRLGQSPNGEYPAIVDKIAEAITAYRENPVATGLDDIRPWMTIRYIANSTGVPAEYLFEQIGIAPADDNEFKPLNDLADEINYEGGPHGLADDIKTALSRYEAAE